MFNIISNTSFFIVIVIFIIANTIITALLATPRS